MRMGIVMKDEPSGLTVTVEQDVETWPDALDTFIAALTAAKYVLGPTDALDSAVIQLQQHSAAIAATERANDFGNRCCE